MLRPPSDYESTRIDLSNRVAKVENLDFDSAIIFFTPKVADKGVNLANLQCTIVQITDRGAWGKEEETFTVDASSFSNRKYRLFDLTTDAKYSLKITPPPELRMGILEIYFDPTQSNIHVSQMGVTNPATQTASTDPAAFQAALTANNAALAQAVGASTGSAVQQALANQAVAAESKNSKTKAYTIKPWSGDINNHLILPTNLSRMGASAAHPGKLISTTNTSTVYIAIGDPAGRDNMKFEYAMAAGGTYIVDPERDTLATYMWLQPGLPLQPDATITVTEYLP
jgi:hypothetical protein